jgi:hypothetical protein
MVSSKNMLLYLRWRSVPWLAVLLMVSCKGCSDDAAARTTASAAEKPSIDSLETGDELQILDTRVFLAAGETDFKNRYSSTIMVTKGAPWEGGACSGVLIAPSLALTAGHCLCEWRKTSEPDDEGRTVISGTACAKIAYVTTVTYNPAEARVGTGGQTQIYEGEVFPHPEFHLQLDHRGQVMEGKADLALIRLNEPVDGRVAEISLADTAVQLDEPLVMAGYGYGSPAGALYGLRFFRRTSVTRTGTTADERVLYKQQGSYLYNGFSGGPCFREEDQKRWLVGVMSLGSDKELAFTDTYYYRDWLRAAIREASASRHQQKEAAQ